MKKILILVLMFGALFINASELNEDLVLTELKKQNVPYPEIVLAQSILETGNYKSKLCKTHNNLFGLRKGKGYRKYNNYKECISDYKRLISSRLKDGEDYYLFLKRIKYAECKDYVQRLKRIVK